jgi:hypothetical protein
MSTLQPATGKVLTAIGFASVRTKSDVTLRVRDMASDCKACVKCRCQWNGANELCSAAHCTSNVFRGIEGSLRHLMGGELDIVQGWFEVAGKLGDTGKRAQADISRALPTRMRYCTRARTPNWAGYVEDTLGGKD